MKTTRNPTVKMRCTLAQLAMKVRRSGGELRMWQAVPNVAFCYRDAAGKLIGGWEETRADGVWIVAYRASDQLTAANPIPARHIVRECGDCWSPLHANPESNADVFPWLCPRCDYADAREE